MWSTLGSHLMSPKQGAEIVVRWILSKVRINGNQFWQQKIYIEKINFNWKLRKIDTTINFVSSLIPMNKNLHQLIKIVKKFIFIENWQELSVNKRKKII